MQTVFRISSTFNCCQSFFVGWTNITGWLIVVTVQGYFAGKLIYFVFTYTSLTQSAQFISAAIVVSSNDSYQITPARTYDIFLAVLSTTTAINIWGNNVLGNWNTGACKPFTYMYLASR